MYKVYYSNQAKKQIKLLKKQSKNLDLLFNVITRLSNNEKLEPKYHDHLLIGKLSGFRECHIQPDWLLIYKIYQNDLILVVVKTGSHSELFK